MGLVLLAQERANMNNQSQQDTAVQTGQVTESGISGDNHPSSGFHGFVMRHMGHQGVTLTKNPRTKPLPVVPILLLIMVALHIIAAVYVSHTGPGAFSLNNPMSYGLIGLLLIFAISKLKHVLGFIRRKRH